MKRREALEAAVGDYCFRSLILAAPRKLCQCVGDDLREVLQREKAEQNVVERAALGQFRRDRVDERDEMLGVERDDFHGTLERLRVPPLLLEVGDELLDQRRIDGHECGLPSFRFGSIPFGLVLELPQYAVARLQVVPLPKVRRLVK